MIHLQICQGTTCYVMGAAQLAVLATNLPDDVRDRVRVTGCRCLGLCRDGAFGGAPYVTIDGEVLACATPDAILAALRTRIQGNPPAARTFDPVRATGGSPAPTHHETPQRI